MKSMHKNRSRKMGQDKNMDRKVKHVVERKETFEF